MLSELITAISVGLLTCWIWLWMTNLIGSRSNIAIYLMKLIDILSQFEFALEYQDYQTALNQADKAIDTITDAMNQTKKFTYFSLLKRKYVRTYLWNIYLTLTDFKYQHVGYQDAEELKARCSKFLKEKMVKVDFGTETSPDIKPTLSFLAIVVSVLNQRGRVKQLLNSSEIKANNFYQSANRANILIEAVSQWNFSEYHNEYKIAATIPFDRYVKRIRSIYGQK